MSTSFRESIQAWTASGAQRMAAGDFQFTNFASILENQRPLDNYWVFLSPQVTDAEWDQRVARMITC